MKTYNITVLKGDGIGPEIIDAALHVLSAVSKKYNLHFNLNGELIGASAIDSCGMALPPETLNACLSSDAILFGAIGDPKYDNAPSTAIRPEQGLLELRKKLALFANVRPIVAHKSLTHLSPLKKEIIDGVDILIYRELTGGIYFGEKGVNALGQTYDVCAYTKLEIERILKLAFEAAQKRSRKITLVDKANVLETSKLWRTCMQTMAANYTTVTVDYLFVDNAAMQLIINPKQFDVIVTSNMFGDILSDEASVISGSIGLLPSSSIGERYSLFEPIHGAYPQAKNKNIANPIATILSLEMLLNHLGLVKAALAVKKAVNIAIENSYLTSDLIPSSKIGTKEIGEYVASKITNMDD